MKKQNTLISILIINYNNAKFINRAINSGLKQTYNNFEILVFDDQSNDNSKNILKVFSKNKKIKVFFNKNKKKNVPAFDAMNGYLFLFKKSKGNIICLLDSDDYYAKNKLEEIYQYFKKHDKIRFLQNLPILKIKSKKLYKKNINNYFSFWPYLAPESCISLKRKFMLKFLKKNTNTLNKFNDVWLGFRLGIYSYFIDKSFDTIEKHLTYYENYDESNKYKTFGYNWFKRRKNSFEFFYRISKKRFKDRFNLDYVFTNTVTKFLS